MRKRRLMPLWLTCALAMSGCAGNGPIVCPEPPKLAPVPAELMTPPTYYQQVSDEFLESSAPARRTSNPSKPY